MINIKIITIILIILGFIVFISLIGFLLYIRPPRMHTDVMPSDFNLKYENISFKTKDRLTLRGWFIPSEHSNATIIVGHGFPFDKNNVLPVTKFLNKHYNLLYYDFRYFGESEGAYTTISYKEQQDLLEAIDYLKKKKNVNSIGLYGFSMSAATFLLIDSKDIKAIVADSSYSSLYDVTKVAYRIFPGFLKYPFVWTTLFFAKLFLGINALEVSPKENVKSLNMPILLIHGTEDEEIPVEHSKILHKNAPNSELWLIEGAGHGMSYSKNPKEYEKRVMDFFDEHLLNK